MQNRTMIIIAVALFIVAALLGLSIFAVLYLTTTEPHPVPVATDNIQANQEIQGYHLETRDYGEQPPSDALTETDQIVDKVTATRIEKGSLFSGDDLRDQFKVVQLRQEIKSGRRIAGEMLHTVYTDQFPAGAYSSVDEVKNKIASRDLEAGQPVTEEDIYQQEEDFVVATESIEPNTIIREEQVKLTSRPPEYPDGITKTELVAGEVSRHRIKPDEVIRESDLHAGELKLSHFIPLHRRAVAVPVQNYNSVGYMINPGDLVDVYVYSPDNSATSRSGEEEEGGINLHSLQMIADAARVLTLNRADKTVYKREQMKEDKLSFDYDQLTMGVTLSEAEKINLVRGMQHEDEPVRFFVLLRPRNLESKYGLRRITNFDLYDQEERKTKDMEKIIEGREVEVIHGDESQTYRVPRY
ncbi:MAG: Flp pilus assembly protein CpaB [bacterium]